MITRIRARKETAVLGSCRMVRFLLSKGIKTKDVMLPTPVRHLIWRLEVREAQHPAAVSPYEDLLEAEQSGKV